MLKKNDINNTSTTNIDIVGENTETFNEYLTLVKKYGYDDGLNNRDINYNVIVSSVRLVSNNIFETINATYEFLKDKLSYLENEKRNIINKIETIEKDLKEKCKSLQLFNGLLYTLAGVAFLFGDIEFSRQTVIKAWNMGNDSWVAQISLIMGIAMTTFFIKLVYQRFVEPKFDDKRKKQDNLIKVLSFVFAGLFIFFFSYLGFVRSIIHQLSMRTNIDFDIYEYLEKYYPHMNTIAFIGIAIMFLIGGAVLLTVGINEFKKYSDYYKLKKTNRFLHSQLKAIEITYDDCKKQFYIVKEKYVSSQKKNFIKKHMEDRFVFFADMYSSGYANGKMEHEKQKKEQNKKHYDSFPNKNFHNAVRSLLDNQMLNNTELTEVKNNV